MATILSAIPQASTRTPHAPKLLATTLLVVVMADGGVAQLPHPVVALVGSWILLLVLVGHVLRSGLTWT